MVPTDSLPEPARMPSAQAVVDRVDPVAAHRALRRLERQSAASGGPPWLHQEVARRMAERLAWIKREPARALDWSGAAGASTAALAAAYPKAIHAHVDEAPDGSSAPLQAWWRRWLGGAGSRPVAAREVAAGEAGLLWSNMRLHFEADPRGLLGAWRAAVAPDGFLMFSTLGPGSLSLLREVHAQQGWGPPHAPFVDMHDLGDMLVESGFAEPVMDQETLTLRYASAQALLDELRGLGANAEPRRFAGLRTPAWRERLLQGLAAKADAQGRIPLQFEVVYGHAFVPVHAGPRVQAHTQIGLAEMKLMLRKPGPRK
jgi:malonyl-CoA O-methyltransferase